MRSWISKVWRALTASSDVCPVICTVMALQQKRSIIAKLEMRVVLSLFLSFVVTVWLIALEIHSNHYLSHLRAQYVVSVNVVIDF